MGLLDFVRDAGKKLGLGDDKPKAAPKPQAQAQQYSREEVERLNNRRRAAGLAKLVENFGFEVKELGIKVEGDMATVTGSVATQEIREKIVLAIGNTAGIGRVDDRLEVAKAEPEAQYHTVVSGDSLSKIAKKFYGNAMKYPVIFEANKPMLTDPDKIYPGQVLRIPALED